MLGPDNCVRVYLVLIKRGPRVAGSLGSGNSAGLASLLGGGGGRSRQAAGTLYIYVNCI
jgi:hypothetical protein